MKLKHFLTFLVAQLAIIRCHEESLQEQEGRGYKGLDKLVGEKLLNSGHYCEGSSENEICSESFGKTCHKRKRNEEFRMYSNNQNDNKEILQFSPNVEISIEKITPKRVQAGTPPPTGLILLFIGVLLTLWSYWRICCGSRLARLVNKFPGPPLIPFVGSVYIFMGPPKNALPMISSKVKKYGKRFRLWKYHNPYVILVDAKDIEVILSSNQHVNKGRDYNQMKWMNGDGLITSSGDMWREDRKLLNPSFKYQRYDGFLDSFNKHGVLLISILKKYFPTGKEVVNIHPTICRCTMDTVFEGVLGATFNIQESAETEGKKDETGDLLYECTKLVMKAYRTRTLKPWLCLPGIRNIMGIERMERESKKHFTEAMIKVIEDRKRSLTESSGAETEETKPFIDVLLGSRSNQNLVDHAFTIFAAGFETNATAMNFVLFLLALNPNCQEKVQEELDRVFQGDGRDATGKDIAELKYMEMCILETMRHFPPAPMFSRNLETDVELDDGAILPKGADVAFFLYELHNDPEVYPSPEEFNPDRFLPEEIKKRHKCAFVPFSKGSRMCIGQKYAMMQMKVVLSHILREFRVSTNITRKDVNIVYGAIIEIDCDIYMTLTPREDGGFGNNNNLSAKQ